MSSKKKTSQIVHFNSIALRLTVWYALLSVALIAAAGGVMYWMLADRLNREDDTFLASKVAEARAVLALHPGNYAALREELQHEGETFPDIHVRVLDEQGAIIADTEDVDVARMSSQDFDAMRWPEPSGEANWHSKDHTRYRLLSQRAGNLKIHAAMRLAKEQRLLEFYRDTLLAAVIVAFGIAVVAGYGFARYGLQPVRRLAAIVDGLGVEKLDRRVADENWPDELRLLADNFDRLLARLDDGFARMSRFSADIAHELRTPLHVLRSEAEMLLARDRSPNQYRENLESALDEYNRLSRMVDALLFVARAEQPDAALDIRALNLRIELESVSDFFAAMAEELGITLTVRAEGQVWADASLLRRALSNLVDNALRHTPMGGTVVLDAVSMPNHRVEIAVRDSGCGIDAEEIPRITDRFYTVDHSRQRRGQGTGLGLAIVQSIMRLHGGELRIVSELNYGTSVVLHFPAPQADGHAAA